MLATPTPTSRLQDQTDVTGTPAVGSTPVVSTYSGGTATFGYTSVLTTASAAATYLPYSGGTLTGPLIGTTSTFSGLAKFGGSSGHGYFDANGDLNQRSGTNFNIIDGTGAVQMQVQNGLVYYPNHASFGTYTDLTQVATSAIRSHNGVALCIYDESFAKPVTLGASSTSHTGNAIVLAVSTICDSTLQLASINTSTTPPTVKGQTCVDSTSGQFAVAQTATAWTLK